MKRSLTAAETVHYLDFNPEVSGSDVTLFGLKAKQLKENDAHKMVNFKYMYKNYKYNMELLFLDFNDHFYSNSTLISFPQALQQGLIPEFEKRLKTKCENVAQHHETTKMQGYK